MNSLLNDLACWQGVLTANHEAFADMQVGAQISLLPWEDAESLRGTMMVWEAGPSGMQAKLQAFDGYGATKTDLILVANDAALETLLTGDAGNSLAAMKSLIRDGDILFYVMKTGRELRALGYEEFLDALGLAYVGACR
jgi:hypothetical protein